MTRWPNFGHTKSARILKTSRTILAKFEVIRSRSSDRPRQRFITRSLTQVQSNSANSNFHKRFVMSLAVFEHFNLKGRAGTCRALLPQFPVFQTWSLNSNYRIRQLTQTLRARTRRKGVAVACIELDNHTQVFDIIDQVGNYGYLLW